MFIRRREPSQVYAAYRRDTHTAILAGIYMGAINPFIGRIARGDLHCSPFLLSLMAAAPFIGNLFSPFWARQMEGKAKMPFAVWSWVIGRGLFFLMPFVMSSWPFVLLVSLSSIILTVSTPAYVSIMKDIYPDRLRGRIMGYIRVSLQTMAFVTALAVGRLLDVTSFRVIFPLAAVAGIAAGYAFNRIPLPLQRRGNSEEIPLASGSILKTLSILRDDRNYRWFALSIFVYGFGNLLVQPLYTLFQVDQLHITNTQVANMANIQSIIAIVAYFYWGRFLDRKGALTTVLISSLMVGLINVVYLLAFRVEHLYLAAAFAGFSFAGIDLAYLNATLAFANRNRIAEYQSIHSSLLGLRGTIAPFLGPVLMHLVGMRGAFLVSLIMILIGGAMQYFGVRTQYRAPVETPSVPLPEERPVGSR